MATFKALTFRAPFGGRGQAPRRRRRAFAQSTPPTATTPPTASAARVGPAGGSGTRLRSATGLVKTRTGQPRVAGDPAQLLVGVDRVRVADRLEHVHVGDRVAVGVAALEVVAALARPARGSPGPSPRRTRSTRCSPVYLPSSISIRVAITRSAPSISPIGPTTSVPDVETMTTSRPARWCSSISDDRLVVDERVDDVVQRVGDDLAHRRDVPAGAQLRHELPHLLHLVVVGAADEVDELGVRRAQHRAPRDQAAGLERLAERQRARLGDDRLVEVEEGRRRSAAPDAMASS